MGVQLNIKAADTVELARDLARQLGKTVTDTVHEALVEKSHRRQADIAEKIRKANAIVEEFQRNLPEEWRGKTSKEVMDAIYDDNEPDGFAR